MLRLRDYQRRLIEDTHAAMRAGHRRIMAVLPTGGGKTAIFAWMAHATAKRGKVVWFLVHRRELLHQTQATFERFAIPTDGIHIGMVGQVARNSTRFPKPDLIVFDECFVAGTRVSGRPIEAIAVGDYVDSFNHLTKRIEKRRVAHVFQRTAADSLMRINGDFVCTKNHPIYVKGRGYVEAKDIKTGDCVLRRVREADQVVRPAEVQARSVDKKSKNVLLQRMCKGVLQKVGKPNYGENEQEVCKRAYDEKEPNAQKRSKRKNAKNANSDWTQAGSTWRKRKRNDRATAKTHACIVTHGSRSGTHCFNKCSTSERSKVADALQNRYCNSKSKNSHRGRRCKSLLNRKAGTRPEEGRVFNEIRVESVEVLERGSDGEHEKVCPDCRVYNLEVEGNNNYFANGYLVHNCHHSPAATWQKIIARYPDAWMIGLTATPCRLDGKPLGAIYQTLVEGLQTAELIRSGWLSPYRAYSVDVADLSRLRRRGADYDMGDAASVLMERAVYGDVIRHYRAKADGLQAIVFCTTVEHARTTAYEMGLEGIRASSIDGTMRKAERDDMIARFRSGEITVLTSCELISEGFDLPAVSAAILLRPTQSLTVYLQQVGRALRPADGKTAIILDHVGNINRHGLPDTHRAWSLTEQVVPHRQHDESGALTVRTCKACYAVYESHLNECPCCGAPYEPTREEIKQIREVELKEITREQQTQERLYLLSDQAIEDAESYSDFCAIAKARGYKVGWAWHRAKAAGLWVPY